MKTSSRIIIAVAALALAATYYLPFWFIYLIAPQYPEGLTMEIWLYKLEGQVEIINGLNHYIGMAKIHEDMFPELDYLPYIMGAYILFGLLVALTGRRNLLFAYLIFTLIFGIAAMVDMYQWGYQYGHNLDPTAPIQVPGLSYQPPLIGHKKLLNFDAYSYPDTGGWIMIGAVVIFFVTWLIEFRRSRGVKKRRVPAAAVLLLAIPLLTGCDVEPAPFDYGKDQCAECRMTIMDPKYGCQVVTKKGKVSKFDDVHCLAQFLHSGKETTGDLSHMVINDYNHNDRFVAADKASFVISPQLKTPMNGQAAAFSAADEAAALAAQTGGKVVNWESLYQSLR